MDGLFSEILYRIEKNEETVLVTIVADEGSSPRGKGSQMLVGEKGRLWGTVGGGNVEHLAVSYCEEVRKNHQSKLHEYFLRENKTEDIGMICGGNVTLWFQVISPSPYWAELCKKALDCIYRNDEAYLGLSLEGKDPILVSGENVLLKGDYTPVVLPRNQSGFQQDGWYFQPMGMARRAILFGAGHVSRALVPVLLSIGFRPIVFDNRPEYTQKEDFPGAEVICGDYEKYSSYISIGPRDFVAIMTNGHAYDYVVEKQVLMDGQYSYLGVIGSRKKTASINEKLRNDGIPEERIQSVHTPIGTVIKAVTPEEIAISIAGEMIYERAILREGAEDSIHHRCPV